MTSLRKSRPLQIAAGAVALTLPASAAAALTTGPAGAGAQIPIRASLDHRRLGYGGRLTVTGSAPTADRGRTLLLQFAAGGASAWRAVSAARIHTDGSFRLSTSLTRSGAVRVLEEPVRTARAAGAASSRPATPGVAPSQPAKVVVGSSLTTARGAFDGGGGPIDVTGTLLPRGAGRTVRLEGHAGRGWRTLAMARTHSDGRFAIRYAAGGAGGGQVRVRFAGDRLSGASATLAHELVTFHQTVASWYDDGGTTACGFHAGLGVANRSLPCGTRVTFRYGGRTVTATALGFGGVDTLLASR
jgi:hypothetical protein